MTEAGGKLATLPFAAFVIMGEVVPVHLGVRTVTSFFYEDTIVASDVLAFVRFYPALFTESELLHQSARVQLLTEQATQALSAGPFERADGNW